MSLEVCLMSNMLIVDMRKEGVSDAAGRVQGIKVKDKIVELYRKNNPQRIVLDFTEVTYITSGLAKELFGGLHKEFGDAMKEIVAVKIGKDNETLKTTIIRALSNVLTRK